jgi:two-component system, cell cycle sensor histidine kinase and response regulator CckA
MKKLSPVKIIIIFLVAGQLWILVTDLLLASVATSPEMFTRLSVLKGWFYNAVLGLLLYWLISRYASERDRVEEALRDSERSYKTLSENLPGIIYRVFSRENSRMQFFNKTAFEITGYLDSELSQGKVCSLEKLILVEDLPHVLAVVEKAIKAHNAFSVEYRLRHKDGSIRFLLEKGTPIYGPDEKILYIDGIIFDITERTQAVETVRRSRETLEKTFRSLDSALFILDNSNPPVITEFNPAATEIFGYEKEELLGHATDFLHVDKQAQTEFQIKNYAAIKERGFLSSFEFRMRRKSGEIFPTEHSVFPLLDDRGAGIGWVSVVRDITKRKRFEQQTNDALHFIRTMMENSPVGIVSIKATGFVVAANDAMARISGGAVDQLLKQNVRFVEAWKKYGLLSAMDEAFATNSEKRIETHYVSTFGKDLWISVSFVPYTFEGEPHVLALFADMSERKRNETERERLLTQLMQAQKMDAIGQLAGGVAHDFNNILTAIIGYGSILQKKMTPNDPLRSNVDQIIVSAGRAAQLTRSLLAFSRKHVLNMKPMHLNEIIARQEQFLRRIIGEDIELKSILRGEAVIVADIGQLEQVLMNLATNARDAMPGGGHLTIETDMMEMTDEFISAYGFGEPGTYAVISVTDTGSGMSDEARQKIFEPFFTTKEVGRGTGLGLAIVYGIVKQHKGYINVYSQVGAGTTFKIYLPVHGERVEQREFTLAASPVMSGTETILLAEDDATLRTFFRNVLTEHGYTVVVAEDGEDAIKKFLERKDEIQICVLDMIMPKKSGKEVFEAIQKMKPGIKVIFSSGYTADKVLREGLPAGSTFIAKPAPPQDYLNKIREVLDGYLTQ